MCCSKNNAFSLVKGTGKSNLRKHLENCMTDYEEIWNNRVMPGEDIRNHILVDKKSQNIYDMLEWVLDDNHAFAFASAPLTRKNSRLDHMCNKTFMKYLDRLSFEVEGK
jgi:hypothetical protein